MSERCARTKRRRLALSMSTILCSGLAGPAYAQMAGDSAPPSRLVLDQNNVNLATGRPLTIVDEVSIGSGANQLSQMQSRGYGAGGTPYDLSVYQQSTTLFRATVFTGVGQISKSFSLSGSTYSSLDGDGSTLTKSGLTWTLTLANGTVVSYGFPTAATGDYTRKARATQIRYPDGTTYQIAWATITYCTVIGDSCPSGKAKTAVRIQSVTSSYGYQLHYDYVRAEDPINPTGGANWSVLKRITALNLAVDYCAPSANTCTFSQAWPYTNYSYTNAGGSTETWTVTSALGRATRYTSVLGQSYAIKRPTSSSNNTVYTLDSNLRVGSVATDGRTWNYAYAVAGNQITTTITNPDSTQRVVISDTNVGLPISVRDELNRTTTFSYDGSGRLVRTTLPEGNYVENTYDARGNVTQVRSAAKAGSGLADISTTANYPAGCASVAACNKPNWTRDAKGAQTDYTWDQTHGGVLTVTAPAPTTGAARPQTRYGYTPLQAYYKNSAGSIVASGVTAYRLTTVSTCRTTASCTNGADETRTTIGYGPQSTGTANQLLPVSTTTAAGDGSLAATTTTTWDAVGNPTYVDGPLTGGADTTRTIYDIEREVVGAIAPDPDGGGALRSTAVRTSYNADGQVTQTELGSTAGQSDTDWANFASSQAQASTYDVSGRKVTDSVNAGGSTYALTQYGYDSVGRLQCAAARMNPAAYGSLPGACSLGTPGSAGNDRVALTGYTAAGEVAYVTSGYGAPEASTDSNTYTPNGLLQTVTDGENNRTSYGYDGFDRLQTTYYPVPTVGQQASNGGDYEQLTYDVNGNVTQRRLRDGQAIGYGYDALNRLVSRDPPNTIAYEFDIAYQYDLLGNLTRATDSNTHFTAMSYDALGRKITEQSNWTTRQWQYDLAGRRTRLTWGDGFYVGYNYLNNGAMSSIVEGGSGLTLASFGYDDLGRRTSLTRGNGTATTYSYDPVSRLSQLTQDLAGSSYDLTLGFGYNPASQIASSTRSNDAYAWGGHYNLDRANGVNGLNQLTTVGAGSLGYDARGNLTSTGAVNYAYTSENRLAWSSTGYNMTYDPLGRYHWISSGGPLTWMQYDGSDIIEERDGNGVTRRYVFGPGTDEPLVWYEGSGTSDRRWLHADERGSVVAVTDAGGNAIRINSYDEYGVPGANNLGRFQYTGQAWILELGLYYYKSRMYSSRLGRFLQTDPIGYGDGMNWYNYVGGDPVNYIDPFGLQSYEGSKRPAAQNGGDVPATDIVVICDAECRLRAVMQALQQQGLRNAQRGSRSDGHGERGGNTPQNDEGEDIVVTARKKLAKALGDFADNYLKPPPGRQEGESLSDCLQRIAGDGSLAAGGATAVASGANIVPYPRAVPAGGSGTSIISTISRGLLSGLPRMGSRILGTTSVGGAIGRGLSRGSVYGGAAAIGFAGGKALGAAQVCSR